MKTFDIYKKRDGQNWKKTDYIYARNFNEAKKKIAKQMTAKNWELSNNINWLTKEDDKVAVTGWYQDNSLLVSEKEINKGFDTWSEDVFKWELRKQEKEQIQ